MASSGEAEEITAITNNLNSITLVVAVGDNLPWFANCLVEKSLITYRNRTNILGMQGVGPVDKADGLMACVIAKFMATSDKRECFKKFVNIFRSDDAYSDLVKNLLSEGNGKIIHVHNVRALIARNKNCNVAILPLILLWNSLASADK